MVDGDDRRAAIERLGNRRDFKTHVVVYVSVNLVLMVIWALSGGGYFWPAWPLLGWGVGLALHWWTSYGQRSISEEDIREEIRRNRP